MRLLLLLALLVALGRAPAAEVQVYLPVHQSTQYVLIVVVSNPGEGTYNTASLSCLQGLFQEALSPSITILPDADVFAGWNAVYDTAGVVQLSHAPFGFTVWDTETMAMGSSVSATGLEENGVAGHQVFSLSDVLDPGWDSSLYDAIIVRSDNPLLTAPNYAQPKPEELMDEAFVALSQDEFSSWSASGHYYVALSPGDFAEWTDFTTEHPGLVPTEDDNRNGQSNFLDYASGQDPEAGDLLPVVEVTGGGTLTLRRRINGSDALATAQYSDNLDDWYPLEEGVHYTVQSEAVDGMMRTLVLKLLPGAPSARFFRQSFGP